MANLPEGYGTSPTQIGLAQLGAKILLARSPNLVLATTNQDGTPDLAVVPNVMLMPPDSTADCPGLSLYVASSRHSKLVGNIMQSADKRVGAVYPGSSMSFGSLALRGIGAIVGRDELGEVLPIFNARRETYGQKPVAQDGLIDPRNPATMVRVDFTEAGLEVPVVDAERKFVGNGYYVVDIPRLDGERANLRGELRMNF